MIPYQCPCSLPGHFYCPTCQKICCNHCLLVEPSVYYCPLCLFEVPAAAAIAEGGKCSRNCFSCPLCSHSLTLNSSNGHVLMCSHCHWSFNVVFERPTGLNLQLQKMNLNQDLDEEFAALKSHYDALVKFANPKKQPAFASSILASIPTLSALSSKLNLSEFKVPVFQSKHNSAVSLKELSIEAEHQDLKATLKQRIAHPERQPLLQKDLLPHRMPLRVRLQKKCRQCETILVKPEPKAQSIKFKLLSVAQDYLPNLSICQWTLDDSGIFVIFKCLNPTETVMSLQFSVEKSIDCQVILKQNEWTLDQYQPATDPHILYSGPKQKLSLDMMEQRGFLVLFPMHIQPFSAQWSFQLKVTGLPCTFSYWITPESFQPIY